MEDILQLITEKEGRKLEFKEFMPSADKIVKTAIAFSNGQVEIVLMSILPGLKKRVN